MNPTEFRKFIVKQHAHPEVLEWAKGRSMRQAWGECEDIGWMWWLISKNTVSARENALLACDFAEAVFDRVDDSDKLACAWAIDCARRYVEGEAELDEVEATVKTAVTAHNSSSYVASAPASAALYATYVASRVAIPDAVSYATDAASVANAAAHTITAARCDFIRSVLPYARLKGMFK